MSDSLSVIHEKLENQEILIEALIDKVQEIDTGIMFIVLIIICIVAVLLFFAVYRLNQD